MATECRSWNDSRGNENIAHDERLLRGAPRELHHPERGGAVTRLLWVGCLVAIAHGCGSESSAPSSDPVPFDGASYWPGTDWRTARPEQVGLDPARVNALVARLRSSANPGVHSLVIVRQGYLAVEEYFGGSKHDDVHTMQSVSKSVTSLMIGIAADQAKVRISDRLLPIFPEYTDLREIDDRKRAVTVRDLLTMRSGIDFYESPYPGSPLEQLNTSRGDWVRLVLDRPMNAAPDGRWQYNSGGVIVLAGVLRKMINGENPVIFARRELFNPIGITTAFWYVSAYDSLPHAGGGLNLRAVDLARIGYLVLRRGKWADRQIVSEQWLDESTTPITSHPFTFGSHIVDYGYLWWLMPINGSGATRDRNAVIYTASGAQGQWLFVIPKYDLVVAVTGGSDNSWVAAPDFLYSDILPAIR
jgi:CubicO group peptidase (beta-lactamase class C family)